MPAGYPLANLSPAASPMQHISAYPLSQKSWHHLRLCTLSPPPPCYLLLISVQGWRGNLEPPTSWQAHHHGATPSALISYSKLTGLRLYLQMFAEFLMLYHPRPLCALLNGTVEINLFVCFFCRNLSVAPVSPNTIGSTPSWSPSPGLLGHSTAQVTLASLSPQPGWAAFLLWTFALPWSSIWKALSHVLPSCHKASLLPQPGTLYQATLPPCISLFRLIIVPHAVTS